MKWNVILEDFFFKVKYGEDFLANTYCLSAKTNDGSSIIIPIIRILYIRPQIYSNHCFVATNSGSNGYVSILVFFGGIFKEDNKSSP